MSALMKPIQLTLDQIKAARQRLDGAVYCSPCPYSQTLSEICGFKAYVKQENLQMTGSFKERGALSKLLTLSEDEKKRGVIAASAGNHAQGVAYHASRLGIECTIVMPLYTPLIKVTNTRKYGANVIVHGPNYDAACEHAMELQKQSGSVFIHPFNDYEVMAGQGTIGLEILEQLPDVDAIIVPVGGGGLIAGIATAVKESKSDVRIIGAQSRTIPSMKASLEEDELVTVRPEGRTIADGIAVRVPGDRTFPIIQRYVDEIVTADEDEIANAILLLLEIEKLVVEGAGAIALAAAHYRKLGLEGKKVVMVLSGGNIDVNALSAIIHRGLVRDGRLVRLRVLLPDRPGTLAELSRALDEVRANVLEITHHRTFTNAAFGEAEVDLDLETEGAEHVSRIIERLDQAGFKPQRSE